MRYLLFKSGIHLFKNWCGKFVTKEGVIHPRHCFNSFGLLFIASGQFDIIENETEYTLPSHSYLITLPNQEHYGIQPSTTNLSEYWCNFWLESDYVVLDQDDEAEKIAMSIHQGQDNSLIVPISGCTIKPERYILLFKQLIESARGEGANYNRDIITESILNILFAYLSQDYITQVVKMQVPHPDYQKIHMIMKWIQLNISIPYTVSQLAENYNYTPNYLSSLFKNVTGQPLIRFINETKISHACSLLTNTRMKVHEIALDCGYSDSKYFFRIFRKMMNMTPTQYRTLYFNTYLNNK